MRLSDYNLARAATSSPRNQFHAAQHRYINPSTTTARCSCHGCKSAQPLKTRMVTHLRGPNRWSFTPPKPVYQSAVLTMSTCPLSHPSHENGPLIESFWSLLESGRLAPPTSPARPIKSQHDGEGLKLRYVSLMPITVAPMSYHNSRL